MMKDAERAVRTIKDLWRKETDQSKAPLGYRATSLEHGFSPDQLLMGKNLRTSLPQPTSKMDPEWPDLHTFRRKDEEGRRLQLPLRQKEFIFKKNNNLYWKL
uniref:Uncharacterized protein n=1 Tax=Oryzias melastigma TaxID=30732 RepID=A0A3B3B883_ORYME